MSKYAPLSELIRLRSYCRRKEDGKRESWEETNHRTLYSKTLGLKLLGKFTDEEIALIDEMQSSKKAFGSARWLWVGGTEWVSKPDNYPGSFNCTNFRIIDWYSFGYLMDLAMQGSGTGAILETDCIKQLPVIKNKLNLKVIGNPGDRDSFEYTDVYLDSAGVVRVDVGDSRKGWVTSYVSLLKLASETNCTSNSIDVLVDISCVRKAGTKLKGFGGTANPIKLKDMYLKTTSVLNEAVGRQLNSLEACLIIDAGASAVVAGNIRRSAGMRQGSPEDSVFVEAKKDLWQKTDEDKWIIDPKRDDLRMANHTLVYHHKPSLDECLAAVRQQFYTSEGAIQYAPEAIVRANVDIFNTEEKRVEFLEAYNVSKEEASKVFAKYSPVVLSKEELEHRLKRYGLNPCGEILGSDFFCNLASVHLNQLDPFNFEEQEKAFKASALQAAGFLQRGFTVDRYQYSRDLDPIVGVSFTGAFTFFVKALGVDWLRWWEAGRPEKWGKNELWTPLRSGYFSQSNAEIWEYQSEYFLAREQEYLSWWKSIVHQTVWEYCDKHGLKRPNRCTTLKPEGSLTLMTGVGCNGFQPPKDWYYIRRMTFAKNDPIALAAIDYGYTVVPSQSDKDENGVLLDDPFDPRCTEWLVEVPVKEEIADISPEIEAIKPSKFSVLAQFDWFMQVQRHYVTHNTSNTLELVENEIEPLANRIYQAIQNNEGYISVTLQARFDAPFPRLPFEVVTKEKYEKLQQGVLTRRVSDDFQSLINKYDSLEIDDTPQDSACSSGACELRIAKG